MDLKETLEHVKVGDKVVRMLAGTIPMTLGVTGLTEKEILCGPYTFSKVNGAEIDHDLGWDETKTGSFLKFD